MSSQLQKSDFAVLVLGFEKLGYELDNCGRTTKNAYCRICSLCRAIHEHTTHKKFREGEKTVNVRLKDLTRHDDATTSGREPVVRVRGDENDSVTVEVRSTLEHLQVGKVRVEADDDGPDVVLQLHVAHHVQVRVGERHVRLDINIPDTMYG